MSTNRPNTRYSVRIVEVGADEDAVVSSVKHLLTTLGPGTGQKVLIYAREVNVGAWLLSWARRCTAKMRKTKRRICSRGRDGKTRSCAPLELSVWV
jgi:hypothetical protein